MKLRYRIYLISFCAIAGFALLYLGRAWQFNRHVAGLLAGCDRVLVETTSVDSSTRQRSIETLEVIEPQEIIALTSSIALWPSPLDECMCLGGPRFRFFRGGVEITTFALAHAQNIKWPELMGREYRLTAASREAIQQWFRSQGYELLKTPVGAER